MTRETTKLLKKVGVPNHIKGYEYIGEAVEMAVKDREVIHLITKALYPSIANKFNTSTSRVEKAIRHAVEISFDNITPDVMFEIFGNTISFYKGKPTNGHFIATLSDLLREGN